MNRCSWAKSDLMIAYHDHEWGVPLHDEKALFELLILEGLQAGLSWEIVLKKRELYREAVDNFDYQKISMYDENKYDELMNTSGLIKNKLKMKAIISNAQAYIKIQEEFGSFDIYIWSYVNNQQIIHEYEHFSEAPTFDDLSTEISKDLKKYGFKFVGPTIIYSYLQAIGIYDDHEISCFAHKKINAKH
ncbi:MAG: DNA-3-methyladenine glycosylase I [Erysipelotrichaceae bacterium]|nr:DNA-3-methyladenine glycosylase I [Erysipelotrichaceae bacterium]